MSPARGKHVEFWLTEDFAFHGSEMWGGTNHLPGGGLVPSRAHHTMPGRDRGSFRFMRATGSRPWSTPATAAS
jgi:hypothetical protein